MDVFTDLDSQIQYVHKRDLTALTIAAPLVSPALSYPKTLPALTAETHPKSLSSKALQTTLLPEALRPRDYVRTNSSDLETLENHTTRVEEPFPKLPTRLSSLSSLHDISMATTPNDYFLSRPKLSVDVASVSEYAHMQNETHLQSPPEYEPDMMHKTDARTETQRNKPFVPLTPSTANLEVAPSSSTLEVRPGALSRLSSCGLILSSLVFQGGAGLRPMSHRNSMITDNGLLTPLEDLGLIINDNQPNRTLYSFLLVDDNAVNLKILERVLHKIFPLAEIECMSDSTKVMDVVASRTFDVVFLDIEMPVVDGVEITKKMRASERYNSWGVVAVTTRVEVDDLLQYESIGIDHTFLKPLSYNYDWLMDVITGVIRKREV